jgi:hypothetical protein
MNFNGIIILALKAIGAIAVIVIVFLAFCVIAGARARKIEDRMIRKHRAAVNAAKYRTIESN